MLSCFGSREEKERYFANNSDMVTAAFAQVPVAVLYRLDALLSGSKSLVVPLRVTADILAGIYSGSIVYWNDTKILQANMENSALLPHKEIKVKTYLLPSDRC